MLRVVALLGVLAVATALTGSSGPNKPAVTVFAAASLREAFEAAAPAFTAHSGFPVRFDFGGSDTLATQLLQGAPADAFASANRLQMQRVASVVDAPRILAKNHLVVIVPVGGKNVSALADLGKPGVRVVLAARTVPIGLYEREALKNLERDPAYGAGFAARVEANAVSEEIDVKAVAAKIALGEGDAAVVYATDAIPIASKARVLRFPPGVAPEAVYPIAAVKQGPNSAGGRAFVTFITSPAGIAYLKARGFAE